MTAALYLRQGPASCPDALAVLPHDVARHEWLAARKLGIGGSDASVVAGVNRWSSRYALWLDKTGRLPDQAATARMEAGTRL
jgi:predicted phage-related endonuclease